MLDLALQLEREVLDGALEGLAHALGHRRQFRDELLAADELDGDLTGGARLR